MLQHDRTGAPLHFGQLLLSGYHIRMIQREPPEFRANNTQEAHRGRLRGSRRVHFRDAVAHRPYPKLVDVASDQRIFFKEPVELAGTEVQGGEPADHTKHHDYG